MTRETGATHRPTDSNKTQLQLSSVSLVNICDNNHSIHCIIYYTAMY
jgi:hypothetical protein